MCRSGTTGARGRCRRSDGDRAGPCPVPPPLHAPTRLAPDPSCYWLLPEVPPEVPPVDGAVPDGAGLVVELPGVPAPLVAGGVAAGGVTLGAGAVAAGAELLFWALSLPLLSQAARPRIASGATTIHSLLRMNSSDSFASTEDPPPVPGHAVAGDPR